MLMAMIDGIKNKINPGEPLDKDIYDLEPEELEKVPRRRARWRKALTTCARTTKVPAARRGVHGT